MIRTLDELKQCDKLLMTLDEIAGIVHIAAQNMRDQAEKNPAMLGFPTVVANGTVRVPRIPFIKFMEGTL